MMKNALVKITSRRRCDTRCRSKKNTIIIATHKHMIFVSVNIVNNIIIIVKKNMNTNVFVKNTKNNIAENKFTM
jgi:hypothetical protein